MKKIISVMLLGLVLGGSVCLFAETAKEKAERLKKEQEAAAAKQRQEQYCESIEESAKKGSKNAQLLWWEEGCND